MTPETPDMNALAARLDAIVDRLDTLEVEVRGLGTSQIVEAKEFVVRDERGEIRARIEKQDHAPRLIFCDRLGSGEHFLPPWRVTASCPRLQPRPLTRRKEVGQ